METYPQIIIKTCKPLSLKQHICQNLILVKRSKRGFNKVNLI